MSDTEPTQSSPEIERLRRRSNDLYQRVIDLERRIRSMNDRMDTLRNSFAIIYMVIIALVVIAGVRWLF
jgi:TolA-binding protein